MRSNKPELKKVTNLDYLTGLSKGNTQFVKEMIDTFLAENPKEIALLKTAIQNRNFEDIRQAAHLLQSSIPFVGLDKIIETEVYEIEEMASGTAVLKKIEIRPADVAALRKIEQLFSKVKEACERACKELVKPVHLQENVT